MKAVPLDDAEARDVGKRVARILRDLGNPEPPLDLAELRALLELDRSYYSSADVSAVQEIVHRVKFGAKQLAHRPTLLLDVIRKADLSALTILDQKRIFIDSETPTLKQRWAEVHEVGHNILPWHEGFLYGDDEETLRPEHRAQIEREANHAAGQLLFLQDRFATEANDSPRTISVVRELASDYGNTITSTLWRFVEEERDGIPLVGLIARRGDKGAGEGAAAAGKHCVESPSFRRQFSATTELELFRIVDSYRHRCRGGPAGQAERKLVDTNGDGHWFSFESWASKWYVLTLGVYKKPVRAVVAIP